jgi:hypothetical protein
VRYGGVFKSTDAGATWNKVNTPPDNGVTALATDPLIPSTIYAAVEVCAASGCVVGAFLKSTDAGESWNAGDLGLPGIVSTLAIAPTTPTTLYAGISFIHSLSTGGVFKATGTGGGWKPANTGLPGGSHVTTLAIDPVTPSTLYAGTAQPCNLATRTDVRVGLLPATAFAIDPITPNTLHAGTPGGGVFSIQQVAACNGDCDASSSVSIDEIITLVNIALGTAQPSACAQGVPSGAAVDVALIIQAVNSALNGCGL